MSGARLVHSVIIPTCSHPDLLARCLAALQAAAPSTGAWEVLVVDNSPEAAARSENARAVAALGDDRFRRCEMPPRGLMAARHVGVEMAQGDIISFLDDDAFVEAGWFEGVAEAFADPRVGLVSGPARPEYETAPPAWLRHFWTRAHGGGYFAYLSLLDLGERCRPLPAGLAWGCNYSTRRGIFRAVKGSHPDYMPSPWKHCQGDGEVALSIKIIAAGHRAMYHPQCAIRHWVPRARFSEEYLGARAYFVGIHGSFTQLRREHGLSAAEGVAPRQARSRAQRLASLARGILTRLWRRTAPQEALPEEARCMRELLHRRYREGWRFHQERVANDPALRQYVLRPHYLGSEGELPA